MLNEEEFWARLAYEAKLLKEEEPTFKPVKGDLTKWRGYILGTGVYDGGVFEVEIEIPRTFPFDPPKVKFLTPIWHPNIHGGRICVGILGKDWTPTISLTGVVETIRNLLNYPNPDDPLNRDAAREMKKNPEKFKKRVKDWIRKYATWEKLGKYG